MAATTKREMQKFRPWCLYIFGNMFLWFRCSYSGRIYFWGLKIYCGGEGVFCIFLALKYSEVRNSPWLYISTTDCLSLNVNSVKICDSISSLLNSDHHLAINGWPLNSAFCQFLILSGCTNLSLQIGLCKPKNLFIFNSFFYLDNTYSV